MRIFLQEIQNFSIWVIDDFAESLKNDLNSGNSSNLFSIDNTVDLVFPNSGLESKIEFNLDMVVIKIKFLALFMVMTIPPLFLKSIV